MKNLLSGAFLALFVLGINEARAQNTCADCFEGCGYVCSGLSNLRERAACQAGCERECVMAACID